MPFPLSLAGVLIALRVIDADRFVQGLFHLGKFSNPIAIATVLRRSAFISVVFCLPGPNSVNSQSLNYTLVASDRLIVLTYALNFHVVVSRVCS
jgi:hypothetical protein